MKSKLNKISMFLLAIVVIVLIPLGAYAGEFSYTEIISPQYDNARTFSEGLAAVKKDGKWGYIDLDENVVLDFKYDVAYSFSENKAIVADLRLEKSEWSDDEYKALYWGIIDRNGNYTPLKSPFDDQLNYIYSDSLDYYDNGEESLFRNGKVMLSLGDTPQRGIFDGTGNYLFEDDFPIHIPTQGILATYYGYLDLNGNKLFADKNFVQTRPFNQGLAPVSFHDANNREYWTIMDRSGKILDNIKFSNFYISDVYGDYKLFNDNSLMSVSNFDNKWGAVNKAGETKIPFKYDGLNTFNEGVAGFKLNGKFGFIDINDVEIIKPQFDFVSSFSNGLATVAQGDNAYLIDKKGRKIEGTENLPKDSYFKKQVVGDPVIFPPGKYVLTKENSKYGFGEVKYTPALPTKGDMSDWALEEVTLAIENKLVPANLQNMYKTDITRVDFAALVVEAIEEVVGEDIDMVLKNEVGQSLYQLVSKYPFKDTTDKNVIAAQALQIINGKGNGEFAPHDTISRQESAALLMRTAKFLGDDSKLESKDFNDQDNIADYAKEAVSYVSSIDVMKGKENNNFAPRDSYTREQAYITIYRLFDVLVTK